MIFKNINLLGVNTGVNKALSYYSIGICYFVY